MPDTSEITRLLVAHHNGDKDAFKRLVPIVYADLRRIAQGQLRRGGAGQTLNATALVHEAYLRLVDETQIPWKNRSHFLAVAARAMRRIIVDYARERQAQKRGGGRPHLELDPERIAVEAQAEDLVALDEVVTGLAAFNERLAQVVECRLFAGLSEEETARTLEISVRSVQRDLQRARAWVQKELTR